MNKSVVILSSVAAKNVDAFNKSGKHATVAVENGNVVVPGAKSTVAGEGDVYVCTTPATAGLATDIFHMVYEAPVPVVNGKYKGITDDPREFDVPAGTVFNMYKPQVGDELVLTADSIAGTKGTNTHIKPANGATKLTWAADATGVSLAYKLEGTTFVSIGNERVTAYKFRCVKA